MKKYLFSIIFLITVVAFQFCNSAKKAQKSENKPTVANITYDMNIAPVIQNSCSPCHISGKGKKEPLDNYTAATEYIDDIIRRIQKNPTDPGFMPMRHPKLSDSTINLFVQWKANGLKQK